MLLRRAIRAEQNAFINVNTPEDLVRVNAIARGLSLIFYGVAGSNELLTSGLLVV
jgi:hypothetical protein